MSQCPGGTECGCDRSRSVHEWGQCGDVYKVGFTSNEREEDKKSQIWTFCMAFFIPNAKHWGQKCGA